MGAYGMQVALTVICVVGLGMLLHAEYHGHGKLRVAGKLVASLAFVNLGLEAFAIRHPDTRMFGLAIFIGLVFGAIGDVALLGHGKKAFLAGLVAFLIGHVAYIVAVTFVEPMRTWLFASGALPVIAGLAALGALWPTLGSMKLPVILYVVAIVTMVIAALAVGRGIAIREPQRYLFLAGAVLFFLSDLAVARNRFVAREFANLAWGLPAYFGGQLLIAWSLVGLP